MCPGVGCSVNRGFAYIPSTKPGCEPACSPMQSISHTSISTRQIRLCRVEYEVGRLVGWLAGWLAGWLVPQSQSPVPK